MGREILFRVLWTFIAVTAVGITYEARADSPLDTTSIGSVSFGSIGPVSWVFIGASGKAVVTIHADGRVEYTGKADDAARALWAALSKNIQADCKRN